MLNSIQRTVEYLLPFVDHEDKVAHLRRDLHIVCAENDCRTFVTQLLHRVAKDFHIDRIKPTERFIKITSLGLATTAEMN